MTQLAFPVEVSPAEISRKRSLGDAIALCVEAGGHEPKELQIEFRWDKGQWSRWISGEEGIKWPKLRQVMDFNGNYVPVQWMAHDVGFDLHAMRRRETETERENRLLREENAALRRALRTA